MSRQVLKDSLFQLVIIFALILHRRVSIWIFFYEFDRFVHININRQPKYLKFGRFLRFNTLWFITFCDRQISYWTASFSIPVFFVSVRGAFFLPAWLSLFRFTFIAVNLCFWAMMKIQSLEFECDMWSYTMGMCSEGWSRRIYLSSKGTLKLCARDQPLFFRTKQAILLLSRFRLLPWTNSIGG